MELIFSLIFLFLLGAFLLKENKKLFWLVAIFTVIFFPIGVILDLAKKYK